MTETSPGTGSTVRGPLEGGPERERARSAAGAFGHGPASPILIVDDNALSLEAIAAALRSAGYDIVTAPNAEAALNLFRPGQFRLVLTDLGMPGLNGFEFLERIRAADAEVRLGVITGWSLDDQEPDLRRRGIDLIFLKPVDPDKLIASL